MKRADALFYCVIVCRMYEVPQYVVVCVTYLCGLANELFQMGQQLRIHGFAFGGYADDGFGAAGADYYATIVGFLYSVDCFFEFP